ncbi:hypothetical protein ACFXHA_12390 [Nocardia sp. NPDC059240]
MSSPTTGPSPLTDRPRIDSVRMSKNKNNNEKQEPGARTPLLRGQAA